MKILVIGGTHGNEPLGINLVKLLKKKKINYVDAVFANNRAIKLNTRFTNQDLNRSFPGKYNKIYEEKRASFLLKLCKKYDLVLDFHNTYCPNNDCAFIGKPANKNLSNISLYLGLNRVIIADYDCINKYAPNCVSVEISLTSKVMDINYWYKKIEDLSKLKSVLKTKPLKKFKFVYRMTLEDRDNYDLLNKNLQAFKPINKKLANAMGLKSPAYPIFINDKYTPYNFGGLLNKIK